MRREVVSSVYEYIQGNVDYDYDKAQNIVDNNVTGYLPDPDETLSTKKGIVLRLCGARRGKGAARVSRQSLSQDMFPAAEASCKTYAWNSDLAGRERLDHRGDQGAQA